MKLTKIFLAILAFALIACAKKEEAPAQTAIPSFVDNSGVTWETDGSIVGQWSLTSYGYPTQPQIYIEFLEDGTFNLYQRFTSVDWEHYNGTYTLNLEDNSLTGKYADGTPLGNGYIVSYGEKNSLKYICLESQNDNPYMQIYEECEIPATITEKDIEQPTAVRSTNLVPFL